MIQENFRIFRDMMEEFVILASAQTRIQNDAVSQMIESYIEYLSSLNSIPSTYGVRDEL